MAYHNKGIMVENAKDLIEYWDYNKNSRTGLNPKMIPINSSVVANWICKEGHSWKEEVGTISRRKNKCFFCSGRNLLPGYNDLQTLYPELAKEWDYEKNNIKPEEVSPKDTNSYWWKCLKGHPSFKRRVVHRITRNDICPYCSGRKSVSGKSDLETMFPEIAAEWDYEGNNGVLPSEVSPNTWKAYKWICPKGHHYSRKVYLRTHSEKPIDCPKCIKAHSTSFPEQAVYFYTKQFYPDAINRYRGLSKSGLELDVYIPSLNIGIEYDGKVFHSSKEAKEKEQRKYNICKKKNIKLIRIKENEEPSFENAFSADQTFYVKKRPNDKEMNEFLMSFFLELTKWTHNHTSFYINPITNKKEAYFTLPVDINIKRDRPKILDYLIDVDNSFGALYPELAKNWDYEANGNLTPQMLPPGSNYPVTFKCERCGEQWTAVLHTVVKWKRVLCKKCSMGDNGINNTKRNVKQKGSLGDKFTEAVEQWDYEANGNLTPFDVPVNYSKEVFWKCDVCGYKWSQSPNGRVRVDNMAGCPHCTGRVAMPGIDDLETLYPEIAKEWDYEKNDGILPSQIRPHSNNKRYWICSRHNINFLATPGSRIRGCGCLLCKGEKIKEKKGFRLEQYSKDLKYIATYQSLNEAARSLDMSVEAIRQATIKGTLSAGFYWKYEGKDFGVLVPDKKHPVVGIKIGSSDKKEFESAREAERKTGVGHTNIMKCCKKVPKYKSAGGYYWYFKGEEPTI